MILFLISIVSLKVSAEQFKIGFKKFELQSDSALALTISEDCFPLGKKSKCLAYEAFIKSKLVQLSDEDLKGGKNPGTMRCKKLNGEVFIGINKDKDEVSLCGFKDNSLVDCGSL